MNGSEGSVSVQKWVWEGRWEGMHPWIIRAFLCCDPTSSSFSCPLQMEDLRPALQQAAELWGYFHRDLREASLLTTRLYCSLRNQLLFSLKQTEMHVEFLQVSNHAGNVIFRHWSETSHIWFDVGVNMRSNILSRTGPGGPEQQSGRTLGFRGHILSETWENYPS